MKLKEIHSSEAGIEMPLGAFATTFFFNDSPGDPIAIFGAVQIMAGVFQVWAYTTELVRRHPFAFHRAVVDLITFWFQNAQLRRMQMSVKVGYHEGCKWAELLGFEQEGMLKKFGPDHSDYYLYAKVI